MISHALCLLASEKVAPSHASVTRRYRYLPSVKPKVSKLAISASSYVLVKGKDPFMRKQSTHLRSLIGVENTFSCQYCLKFWVLVTVRSLSICENESQVRLVLKV